MLKNSSFMYIVFFIAAGCSGATLYFTNNVVTSTFHVITFFLTFYFGYLFGYRASIGKAIEFNKLKDGNYFAKNSEVMEVQKRSIGESFLVKGLPLTLAHEKGTVAFDKVTTKIREKKEEVRIL